MTAAPTSFFVVHTQPNCEDKASKHLQGQSCDVYYPRVLLTTRHARRTTTSPRPFLPRYMFVRDDGRGVSFIKRSFGVHDVVRNGLEPARAPLSVIRCIMEREDADGFVRLEQHQAAPTVFQPGQMLKTSLNELGTPLRAIFKHMIGETRALVLLCILNRQVATTLPLHQLEAA